MDKTISVVIPVHNEETNIARIAREVQRVLGDLPYAYEIIFVNDGSKDSSLAEIFKLSSGDGRIKALDFTRNFGKEVALSAGCHAATGDAVITMDADLQHPPGLIPTLVSEWEKGSDVVYTVRKENGDARFLKRLTSKLYWWVFDKITSLKMEPHSTDFRLMDARVVEVFRKFPEQGRIFRGIVDWMGFRRTKVEFVAPDRAGGTAAYSYKKLFGLAVNSLTAFSLLPLRIAGYFGIVITLGSGVLLTAMLATRWFFDASVFTPIAILATGNTLLIGIVLISLGLIALYIARIHDEVIGRPLYIVRERMGFEKRDVRRKS